MLRMDCSSYSKRPSVPMTRRRKSDPYQSTQHIVFAPTRRFVQIATMECESSYQVLLLLRSGQSSVAFPPNLDFRRRILPCRGVLTSRAEAPSLSESVSFELDVPRRRPIELERTATMRCFDLPGVVLTVDPGVASKLCKC